MRYKCCNYLLHQIVFDNFDIKPCCSSSMNKDSAKFIDNFDGKDFNLEEYIKQRRYYIDCFKSGEIPKCCQGCELIQEDEWNDNEIYFDRIIMANIAKCSCNCIYCVYTHDNPEMKSFYNTKENYDIKPILTKLRNQNLIKDNFVFVIGGGECSEFPKGELEWLIYFTSLYNGQILLLSSGIKYSQAIEQVLKSGKSELSISPDAGTKRTYEKIKQVKAFDIVWKNLEKYVKAAKENPQAMVEVKYIIIPNVNDNISEVKSFIKKCQEIAATNIHVDIEHYWFAENKNQKVPNNIKEIIKLFNNLKNVRVTYSIETENWLNEKGNPQE